MIQKNVKHKVGSILAIFILVCSGLLIIIPLNPNLPTAQAASTWLQTSTKNFKDGTLNNTTIFGSSEDAELKIDMTGHHTWTKKTTYNRPGSGYYHEMATIWGVDKVLLFGGYWYYSYYTFSNETWIYDLSDNNWTRKLPLVSPASRYWHVMACIWGTDKVLLFGGYSSFTDTWIYDLSNNTWTNMEPINHPLYGAYNSMAPIYGTKKVLLLGGGYNETWVYDLNANNWTKRNTLQNPSSRTYQAMSSIDGTDKVVLFGGLGSGYLDDTWVYDYDENTWVQKIITKKPKPRAYHAMAPIYGTSQVILFGGWWAYYDDIWVYDLITDTWTQKIPTNPSGTPTSGYWHTMASVWGTDKVVLYGGYWGWYNDDTWIYKHFSHPKNGTYISSAHDTGSNPDFRTLSWEADIPAKTSLRFQLRSGNNKSVLYNKSFVGPDGKTATYYTSSPVNIWSEHDGEQWIQYKVYFNMDIFTDSPALAELKISYNCLPTTIIVDPIDNSILTHNRPIFVWIFQDRDSKDQNAFQVLIANDSAFENIAYDSGIQKTTEQRWEFGTGTSYSELPDGTWYWKARTQDEDDTWTEHSIPRELLVDTLAPSTAPDVPINNEFYRRLDWVFGKATDGIVGSGIYKVEIALKRLSDNTYWDGFGWGFQKTWLRATGTTNWTYDSRNVPWESGIKYNIQSRATDIAANVEVPDSVCLFTIDTNGPQTIIETPINNAWWNNLDTISGTATDYSGSGVEKVEINIRCSKDNNYWDGTAWLAPPAWLPVTGADKWTFDSSNIQWMTGSHVPWAAGTQYLIRTRGTDKVGNLEIPSEGTTFLFDDQIPEPLSIFINNGDEYTTTSEVVLSLQAEDIGSGVSKMSFSTDGSKWSDWEPYNTTRSFSLPNPEGNKSVYFRVRDYTGNTAIPVFDTIILDTTPPEEAYILINNDKDYATSEEVIVDLFASDSVSGVSEISLSFNGNTWYPWESFRSRKTMSLPTGDGKKTIYFKVSDKAGNIAEPVFDSITLDTSTPHSIWVLINDGATETNSTHTSLKLSALDNTSGICQISFSTDGIIWCPWENYTGTRSFELDGGDGEKRIYFRVNDYAGNIANPVHDAIFLNTEPPEQETRKSKGSMFSEEFWILLLILIIILIVQLFVIIGMKRMKRRYKELSLAKTVSIKPSELGAPVIAVGQLPAPATALGSAQQLAPPTAPAVPQLAKSTYAVSGSVTAQSAYVVRLPQLPPAKIDAAAPATEQKATIAAPVSSNSAGAQNITVPKVVQPATPIQSPAVHLPDTTKVEETQPIQKEAGTEQNKEK